MPTPLPTPAASGQVVIWMDDNETEDVMWIYDESDGSFHKATYTSTFKNGVMDATEMKNDVERPDCNVKGHVLAVSNEVDTDVRNEDFDLYAFRPPSLKCFSQTGRIDGNRANFFSTAWNSLDCDGAEKDDHGTLLSSYYCKDTPNLTPAPTPAPTHKPTKTPTSAPTPAPTYKPTQTPTILRAKTFFWIDLDMTNSTSEDAFDYFWKYDGNEVSRLSIKMGGIADPSYPKHTLDRFLDNEEARKNFCTEVVVATHNDEISEGQDLDDLSTDPNVHKCFAHIAGIVVMEGKSYQYLNARSLVHCDNDDIDYDDREDAQEVGHFFPEICPATAWPTPSPTSRPIPSTNQIDTSTTFNGGDSETNINNQGGIPDFNSGSTTGIGIPVSLPSF